MRNYWLTLLLAIGLPLAAHGETIYSSWLVYSAGGVQLTRFDSESPWLAEDPFPPDPGLPAYSLEFDPSTRELWGFDYFLCNTLCPPALDPVIIDPLTGGSSFVHLPGLELQYLLGADTDIDPLTRELRYFGGSTGNFSYSLDLLKNRSEAPLDPPFYVAASAHKPPIGKSTGVETYVIGRLATPGRAVSGAPWYQLARIGGPGGNPPASSGQVTVIGPVDLEAERLWFDISEDGTAYLAALLSFYPGDDEYRLFQVDLESGALEEVGDIAPPSAGAILSGIAVAPSGLGGGVVEIPALSRFGAALFALVLCAAALRRAQRRRSGA